MDEILREYSNVISVIIGAILSYILNKKIEKNKFKESLKLQIFQQRNQSIEEVYKLLIELKKYYELFIHPGQEFEEQLDYMSFSPLAATTEFRNKFESKEIFLKNEMRNKIKEFASNLGMGCTLALYLHDNIPEINEEAVFSYCQSTMNEIEDLLTYLRSEINKI